MQINLGARRIHCKIVYYGPGCSGKTTNIQKVHEHMPNERKSDLTSIATKGDRTLFFDFMSLDLGQVAGMDTSFQLYTVPGQVYYKATRKLVLQGVDGLVFVADCSPDRFEANLESWRDLAENLVEYSLTLDDIPVVIQFNKRDVPGAVPTERINELINKKGFKTFESVASRGEGVLETLKAVCSMVIGKLSQKAGPERISTAAAPRTMPVRHAGNMAAGTRAAGAPLKTAAIQSPTEAMTAVAVESPVVTTAAKREVSPHAEGIAMVSLDYKTPQAKPVRAKATANGWSKPAGTTQGTDNDTIRKQFASGRPLAIVKPAAAQTAPAPTEAKGDRRRMAWIVTLGGLAAAAAGIALVYYFV